MAEFDAILASRYPDPSLMAEAMRIPDDGGLDVALAMERFRNASPYDIPEEQMWGGLEEKDWNSGDEEYFDANLAKFMDRTQLGSLANDVIEWVRRDQSSRSAWEYREARGIEQLGVTDGELERMKKADPQTLWESTVTHPGLQKAVIQFWARSLTQIWPAGGPANALVIGHSNEERQQQALRVKHYLNYLYTEDMPGGFQEMSQLLYRLPLSGSVFKKQFYEPTLGTLCSSFIEPTDFIKPYSAVDIRNAVRYTHLLRIPRYKLMQLIAMGYYLNVVKGPSEEETIEHSRVDYTIDQASGHHPALELNREPTEYDNRDILFECSALIDLEARGYRDPLAESFWTDRETGELVPEDQANEFDHERIGIGMPYLVTVHRTDREVLSIRRHWRENDPRKRRRRDVVEYKFLPGLGGYGFGLLHVAGGLSDAQTETLRYFLNGCQLATRGRVSGYVDQTQSNITGLPGLRMGEFQGVRGNGEDLGKAVWTPDFKFDASDPIAALNYLDGQFEFLVASVEAMVGSENKNIPVGTQLIRIEETTRPFAAIFSLLHQSLREEMRSLAELAADYLPPYYPYAVEGEDRSVMASDFDDRVDVGPVSDPNIVSATQRLIQAQALMEHTRVNIEILGPEPFVEAWRNMIEVMRIPDAERFMPVPRPQQEAPAEVPDPTAADIARKDAESAADIRRKDAAAGADIRRKNLQNEMAVNPAIAQQGEDAIVVQETMNEAERTRNRIIDLAQARRAELERGGA